MTDSEERVEIAVSKTDSSKSTASRYARTATHEARIEGHVCLRISTPELLRAVQLPKILHNFGFMFWQSQGTAETFDLSQAVECMDIFLSHSWRTPGWLKTLGLMYTFNVRAALFLGAIVQVLVHGLDLAGVCVWPGTQGRLFGSTAMHVLRWKANYIVGCAVTLVLMLFWKQVPGPFQQRPTCFLDKCCIHQTDEEKKSNGIKQLGAFLRMSDKMMILWQPEYFTRLWCVYELAAFAYMNKLDIERRLTIVPLKLTLVTIGLYVFHFVASMSFTLLGPITWCSEWHAEFVEDVIAPEFQYIYLTGVMFCMMFVGMYFLPSFALWKFAKWHMRDRRDLLQQLHSFTVEKASCFVESDRSLIEGHIEDFFGDVQAFEQFVQTRLARNVEAQFKAQPMPYSMVLVGSSSHLFIIMSFLLATWQDDEKELFRRFLLVGVAIVFCTDAIGMSLMMRLADTQFGDEVPGESNPSFFRRLTGRLAGPAAAAAIFSLLSATSVSMMTPAMPLWASCVLTAVMASMTIWLYSPRAGRQRANAPGGDATQTAKTSRTNLTAV
jgi:hypothetical protein